ncbi:hypothetical protein UWK_00421 [Desulfocapsa sulfexigens DSM 10523]|uniref:Uncharacterized protein n=1 Tax=Desulfocapsa sulfexigens (strain DSM 10523 / SB164P1) TaxID=1167006 RepID=M1PB86_DESSD|nr:hypothetical protein [Desulfocapsa sulfexigens]AGF77005.1 hypothetical protein UWK_00421 [Desulfocapsa sulfexigens DSM 10523]
MQSLNSLYFPETVLPRHLRNCLLLFPDTLHLLQPVESGTETIDKSPESDIFMEQGICQVHTPSLLGKDRNRFLKLVEEIRIGKDDIVQQLSGLTLAHLSKEQDTSDKSHRAIMTTLLGGQTTGESDSAEETQKAALWQARLVLALAEILDKEEAELATKLSDIDDTELALFEELLGDVPDDTEETDSFAELMRIRANINHPRPGTLKRRIQAWKTLYSSGSLPEKYWLWMTSQEEAAELLIDNYEEKAGRNSVPLLLLDLPEHLYMRDKDGLESIRKFQEQEGDIRRNIIEKLTAIVSKEHLNSVDPVALLPDAGILAREWNDLIEYHFPEKRFGRRKLDFQFLANISLDQLVRGVDEEKQSDTIRHGIVAIYKE